jgi:hypothetical protein
LSGSARLCPAGTLCSGGSNGHGIFRKLKDSMDCIENSSFFKKFWTNTLDIFLEDKDLEERAGENLRKQ